MSTPTAQEMLALYIEAEAAVLAGKEYQKNGMIFKREDLDKIIAGRREWQLRVTAEQRTGARVPSMSIKTANFDVC